MSDTPTTTRRWYPLLGLFAAGGVAGVLSWALAWVISGRFEPYDSSLGLLVNQLLLCASLALLLRRAELIGPWLYFLGAWLGMNAFSYFAGSSESRAWAQLGAVISLLLLALPVSVWVLVALWCRLRLRSRSSDGQGGVR